MGLEAIINWILSIWRFVTPFHWISPWEGGVRISQPKWARKWLFGVITRKGIEPIDEVVELQPGIHPKIPGLQRVHQTVTATQPLNLPPQSITTKDGKKVNVSGIFMYSVKSVKWFFTKIHDQDSYLRDAGLRALTQTLSTLSLQEILDKPDATASAVLEQAKKNTRGVGYQLESFGFSDLQEGKSLRILFGEGHDPYNPS